VSLKNQHTIESEELNCIEGSARKKSYLGQLYKRCRTTSANHPREFVSGLVKVKELNSWLMEKLDL